MPGPRDVCQCKLKASPRERPCRQQSWKGGPDQTLWNPDDSSQEPDARHRDTEFVCSTGFWCELRCEHSLLGLSPFWNENAASVLLFVGCMSRFNFIDKIMILEGL